MGSTHTYDIKKGDLQVSIENPEDLEDLDAEALKDRFVLFCFVGWASGFFLFFLLNNRCLARYEQAQKGASADKEDLSDMVADHARQQAKKRKATTSKDDKGAKKFKF
jgi:hypothetical protein